MGRYKKQVQKIKEIFIDQYPAEEVDIERFLNGTKVEEVVTKETLRADFRKAVGSGKRVGVGMLFLHFIAYAKVSGEAAYRLIVF